MPSKIFISIFLSALCFSACATSHDSNNPADQFQTSSEKQVDAVPQKGWKTLTDSLYTFQYPENWEMNYTGQMGLSFLVVSPFENDADPFGENISLVIQDRETISGSLAEYAESSVRQITDVITDGKILKNEEASIHGVTYREITYSGNQNDMDFKNTLRFYFFKGNAFILTFTCHADDYETHINDIRKVMDSLRLK